MQNNYDGLFEGTGTTDLGPKSSQDSKIPSFFNPSWAKKYTESFLSEKEHLTI